MKISDTLPGADLIRDGLADLEEGTESIPALLVLIGAPRLRRLGFDVSDSDFFPEDRLYAKLAEQDTDSAHSRYNALIRTLVSFERSAEMSSTVNEERLHEFMKALAAHACNVRRIYLTGVGSPVLNLKIIPEDEHVLRALPELKKKLEINVALGFSTDFELPGWQSRSPLIARYEPVSFHHYDFYSQALSKLERRHREDLTDLDTMVAQGLVKPKKLLALFEDVTGELYRYPAIDPRSLRGAVERLAARG